MFIRAGSTRFCGDALKVGNVTFTIFTAPLQAQGNLDGVRF